MRSLAAVIFLVFFSSAWASTDSALADLVSALAARNMVATRAAEERILSGNESIDTLLHAGSLLAGHDMLADAAAVFEKCAERFPASFEAKYNLALAHIGQNEYSAAEEILKVISPASARESAAVDYLNGKVYTGVGRQREARQSFENAYRGNPAEENYALDLALLYIRSSVYVPAIEVLETARIRHPESEELALELATAEALSGQLVKALAVCQELLRQDPTRPTPRVIAAFAQCLGGNYPGCEAEASAGLTLPQPNPYLYYLHAEALWNAGASDHAKMLSELGTAIDKLPACSVCLLLRSKVLQAAHDDRAALADLEAAVAQDAQLAPAWYLLSALYRRAGQSADALIALSRYRALRNAQENGEIENFRKQVLNSFADK
jgi:tetratricopeptide (TPR) repeat protein